MKTDFLEINNFTKIQKTNWKGSKKGRRWPKLNKIETDFWVVSQDSVKILHEPIWRPYWFCLLRIPYPDITSKTANSRLPSSLGWDSVPPLLNLGIAIRGNVSPCPLIVIFNLFFSFRVTMWSYVRPWSNSVPRQGHQSERSSFVGVRALVWVLICVESKNTLVISSASFSGEGWSLFSGAT